MPLEGSTSPNSIGFWPGNLDRLSEAAQKAGGWVSGPNAFAFNRLDHPLPAWLLLSFVNICGDRKCQDHFSEGATFQDAHCHPQPDKCVANHLATHKQVPGSSQPGSP